MIQHIRLSYKVWSYKLKASAHNTGLHESTGEHSLCSWYVFYVKHCSLYLGCVCVPPWYRCTVYSVVLPTDNVIETLKYLGTCWLTLLLNHHTTAWRLQFDLRYHHLIQSSLAPCCQFQSIIKWWQLWLCQYIMDLNSFNHMMVTILSGAQGDADPLCPFHPVLIKTILSALTRLWNENHWWPLSQHQRTALYCLLSPIHRHIESHKIWQFLYHPG